MTLRQRQPPKRDHNYLAWLRTQRCACGCLQGPPCDAAHLRASSFPYNKELSGLGAKPDDRWAMPLRHSCHMRQHAYGDELGWWAAHGVKDPFALAIQYHQRFRRRT